MPNLKMNAAQHIVTKLLRAYQLTLSSMVGWHCRFEPSCSQYMKEAVIEYGAIKGVVLGIKRLTRCHPWGGHGYDPVMKDVDEKEKLTKSHPSTSSHR